MTAEHLRLEADRERRLPWKKWGPYLSERQWGTVREDYSEGGDAWQYFSHDQARSRAYRWGEDGLAGFSDDQQQLCFALALWNGKDPILKERLFGLTNSEANHGEDVKEYYFYLDSTPTHSYMKYLYKYPQAAFPYSDLVETNRGRGRNEFEYELLDTHVFDEDRYFDVFVEYAKATPEDILIKISVHNRGPETAELHVLPTLWFRNRWSWQGDVERPLLNQIGASGGVIKAVDSGLGERYLYCEGDAPLLFTENETNTERIFGAPSRSPYVKDSINNYLVNGQRDAVNPDKKGTKAAAHYHLSVGPGECQVVRLRLSEVAPTALTPTNGASPFGKGFEEVVLTRQKEADEFYASITPDTFDADQANVMRQAVAGMLWSKQFYHYDVDKWLEERGSDPFKASRRAAPRNDRWHHMYNGDVISMPDKWEYPWYAAWDLAFHVLALTLVDPDFGKQQLKLMLRERYMHPNGQIPAYEWNFGDVNPPVHAWSTIFTYRLEKAQKGEGDKQWLKSSFQKLLLNFTWWVNRKDAAGRNVFQGGFLGLDNIGVFDRSQPLPTGGHLEQSDGTSWMGMFCLNMLAIALELAEEDAAYEDVASKFFEHFVYICRAMNDRGGFELWNEEDGFFYDVLHVPERRPFPMKIRSMVGLIPLFAVETLESDIVDRLPGFKRRMQWFIENRPDFGNHVETQTTADGTVRRFLSLVNRDRLRSVLRYLLDENEFLSPYGVRALSRWHKDNPYTLHVAGTEHRVDYEPAESKTGVFGGNSNWRGPVWFPVNYLIIESLQKFHHYLGDSYRVELPLGSGRMATLWEVASELSRRLTHLFLRDGDGRRPIYGGSEKFQRDPHFRDHVLFFEYFHGDNGAGLGASHQTGWTGLVAKLIQQAGE